VPLAVVLFCRFLDLARAEVHLHHLLHLLVSAPVLSHQVEVVVVDDDGDVVVVVVGFVLM